MYFLTVSLGRVSYGITSYLLNKWRPDSSLFYFCFWREALKLMWPWFFLPSQIYAACREAGYWKVRIHIQRTYKSYVLVIPCPGYVLALLVTQCKDKILHDVACLLEVSCIFTFYLKLTWRKLSTETFFSLHLHVPLESYVANWNLCQLSASARHCTSRYSH